MEFICRFCIALGGNNNADCVSAQSIFFRFSNFWEILLDMRLASESKPHVLRLQYTHRPKVAKNSLVCVHENEELKYMVVSSRLTEKVNSVSGRDFELSNDGDSENIEAAK